MIEWNKQSFYLQITAVRFPLLPKHFLRIKISLTSLYNISISNRSFLGWIPISMTISGLHGTFLCGNWRGIFLVVRCTIDPYRGLSLAFFHISFFQIFLSNLTRFDHFFHMTLFEQAGCLAKLELVSFPHIRILRFQNIFISRILCLRQASRRRKNSVLFRVWQKWNDDDIWKF